MCSRSMAPSSERRGLVVNIFNSSIGSRADNVDFDKCIPIGDLCNTQTLTTHSEEKKL